MRKLTQREKDCISLLVIFFVAAVIMVVAFDARRPLAEAITNYFSK